LQQQHVEAFQAKPLQRQVVQAGQWQLQQRAGVNRLLIAAQLKAQELRAMLG
jgi:hypothetical protein